ncbi:TonB-dependent receptor [Granulicella sp. 5B5]|uniref:TonB-dependent receptor n=1 Tax=Granulicella sp. 5B5 TaxID=1617967 RepID=UPI0015F71CE6|nr:carboxypeptidase regulatory-like domain-containing protein [Granulicella sp. 5B5]QMV18992.1 TonB-dependent receptor [Granulicella sp. 5B5]
MPSFRRKHRCTRWLCALACFAIAAIAHASEHHGQVAFNNLPVPGATVTVTHGTQKLSTVTNADGSYAFPDLADGSWKIDIEMPLFEPIQQSITITPNMPGIRWDLKMLPLPQVLAKAKVIAPAQLGVMAEAEPTAVPKSAAKPAGNEPEAPRPAEEPPPSNDGFLVNGTVNNAATSQFTLAQGFGNTRKGTRSLYNGGIGVIYDNSALDARPYSLSGLDSPKSAYNTITGVATLGGPIRIPHVLPRGPNFFVAYQWTRSNTATNETSLVPTLAQRSTVPIDPIAQALLALYPEPNSSSASYNYQTPVVAHAHQDALQSRLEKSIGRRDDLYGNFAFQSTRSDNTSLFGFRDQTGALGMNLNANWQHRFNAGLFATLGFNFSRVRTLITPNFENRQDIEGGAGPAGIAGVDSSPVNWGPPTLVFSSGIATLTDAQSAFNRNRTDAVSPSVHYYRGRHNITAGIDFRRQEFNYFSQQDPRGTFTFTGTATGSDFSDFAAGTPDTASINYGNADKYLRQSVYDAYITDDWRLRPEFTIDVGVRWEYGAPITELKDRLVNLDVAPNFTAVEPVLASAPTGPLTGRHYPTSLILPDRRNVEPRIGLSWRPIPGSSLVLRGGYGIYADTSVYQATALQLAEEPPLTTNTLSAQNSTNCPLSLSSGLVRQPCTATTPNSFAVDPNFRVGYAQTWQLSAQRDLPFALQMTATYLGIKGTRGVQEFLPNTYPVGGANPCPSCPSGFTYRTSNGDSTRESGSFQLRRRLRSGFSASVLYTFSKSIDDDSALGGQGPVAAGATSQSAATAAIAQNWLDLRAERGRSTFDQRHLLSTSFQYSTGTGLGGGTLLSGWRGRIYKEWTFAGQITAGSGLPETPIYLAATNGTGVTGNLRPDRTTAPLYTGTAGHFLNAAAFTAPQPGQWGNAGRDSITGPGSFSFNASLSRTFRIFKTYNLDIRVNATNLLNHAVFTSYNTTISPSLDNPVFGLPAATSPMRSLQTTARLRF